MFFEILAAQPLAARKEAFAESESKNGKKRKLRSAYLDTCG